jgi:hypothetical protein
MITFQELLVKCATITLHKTPVAEPFLSSVGKVALHLHISTHIGADIVIEDYSLVNKSGKLAKRIAKLLFENHAIRLDETQRNALGDVINRHTVRNDIDRFDVIGRTDWNRGEYGDSGSCYWSDRRVAREYIHATDNWGAIRFYSKDGNGNGRAWVHYDAGIGVYFLFNAYGHRLADFAEVLAAAVGATEKDMIRVENCGATDGMLWINSGNNGSGYLNAYALSDKPITIKVHDFGIDIDDRRVCTDCGYEVNEDYCYTDNDGNCYCEDCYNERYTSCDQCGDECYNDCVTWIDSEQRALCEYCLDRFYTCCWHCDQWVRDSDAVSVGYHSYCNDCALDLFTSCESCCDFVDNDSVTEIDGYYYCDDCANDNYTECEDCGKVVPNEDRVWANGYFCPDCVPVEDSADVTAEIETVA